MIAAAHFTIGGKSVMTAADMIVPATKAGVEQIVDARNVISEDLGDGRDAKQHQRGRGAEPGEGGRCPV
jgi:hypothetical protein